MVLESFDRLCIRYNITVVSHCRRKRKAELLLSLWQRLHWQYIFIEDGNHQAVSIAVQSSWDKFEDNF